MSPAATRASVGRRLAVRTLSTRAVSAAAGLAAAVRGRALVLVYHRVSVSTPSGSWLVPTVSVDQLRQQVQVLGELGDLVSLHQLRTTDPGARVRFALTFDDDYASHHEHVLPLLGSLGATATFFLGGRGLHGLGPYWWETLEALVNDRGVERAARQLGLPDASRDDLVAACRQSDALRQELEGASAAGQLPVLTAEGIRGLSQAGMPIGFHTLRHDALPALSDAALDQALTDGRQPLEDLLGGQLDLFAYPYGEADARVVGAARRHGYVGAWTGRPAAMTRTDDPLQHPRWEPGPMAVDDFVARVALRLSRGARRERGT